MALPTIVRLKPLTLEAARRIGISHSREIREFCDHVTLENLDHEDQVTALLAMAHTLKETFEQLCSLVYLIVCVENGDEEWISSVLQKVQLSWDELQDILDLFPRDEAPAFPWETKEDKLEDLLAEAASLGR